ncbi:MAG: type I restriction enzyme HsdR N-terminal domain-containing protein [Bacteroidetes bacterium]|nr:type I restriction enzyme HsdR N-terminal domain-containing protein [Bacteroidota bacterium]
MTLPPLPFPPTEMAAGPCLWDPVRRKWVAATPEEEVRQRLIAWLLSAGVSPAHMAVERALNYGRQTRRFDVVVFSARGLPALLCECKEPGISLNMHTWFQAITYNAVLQAPLVLVTNGTHSLWAHTFNGKWEMGAQDAGTLLAALQQA